MGFVPLHEVDNYFAKSSIFVSSSKWEGFPTTFLQAWARSSPIVSLNVDSDGVIAKKKSGFVSRTFEKMRDEMKLLLEDETLRRRMGQNGREYITKEQDVRATAKKYIDIFEQYLSR